MQHRQVYAGHRRLFVQGTQSCIHYDLFRAVVLAAALCVTQIACAGSESIHEQFFRIQKTIEANCADCNGASKEEFIKAVKALENLIASGLADQAADRLLAESYRVWALVYSDDQNLQEKEELLRKEQSVYAKLVREQPTDAALWLGYARSLPDAAARLEALKRAESLALEDAAIQYNLGMLYAHGLGDSMKAIAHLERAMELEPGYAKLKYGDQLARTLEGVGEHDKAKQVRSNMKAFERTLELRDRSKQAESKP